MRRGYSHCRQRYRLPGATLVVVRRNDGVSEGRRQERPFGALFAGGLGARAEQSRADADMRCT